MTSTRYDNCGILTKMGDDATHNGDLIPPVDGVDFPHSGLFKLFDSARYGYVILGDNKTTGSTTSTSTSDFNKNFNISMNDTSSSGKTTIFVSKGAIIRNGQLSHIVGGGGASAQTLTEVTTVATDSSEGTDTDGHTTFQELGNTGENFYHVIVVNHANNIRIRRATAKDVVAALGAGDIPIAIVRIQKDETNKYNRHIQYLGTDRRDGALSIYYSASNVPTEMSKIEASSAGTTITVGSAGGDFIIDNTDADKKIVNRLGTDTNATAFEVRNNSNAAKFSVDGAGDCDITGNLDSNSLSLGSAAELTITESSDNITFANTVNDKTLTFSVKDGSGAAKTASFTADTHDNNIQLKGVEEVIIVALSDETTDLTTGTGKATFHMPFAMTLTKVKASVNTAPQGATIIVDINEATASGTILSTKLSIDANETTSETAASAAVISDTALADNAAIFFDIDQVGSSTAGKGLKVTLYGHRA